MLRAGTFYVPNSWAFEVARSHAGLLPGVSIHPAREDALRELERCIEAGAVLLKMLPPSQNIDCALPKYREFFKMMADAGLPLLAHTGGEYTVPVLDRRLCDPQTLRQPLDLGVKVIAAHMATRSAPPLLERDYFPVLTEMMREYPHLYGDNSALNSPNRSHGLRGSLREDVVDRVVHGSDYPVPVSGRWALLRRLVSREQLKHAHVSKNPLERDLRLKQSMGFGPEVFTRAWRILRVPGT
jgi:predicted TIM-barrel fold metal-dependent hydrolase